MKTLSISPVMLFELEESEKRTGAQGDKVCQRGNTNMDIFLKNNCANGFPKVVTAASPIYILYNTYYIYLIQ